MKNNQGEKKILNAALKVVAKNTISGTRMRLIADEAGIVQSNIHYYFKNKNELMVKLRQITAEYFFEYRAWLQKKKPPQNLEDQIQIFLDQKIHFILNDKDYDFVEMDFWMQTRVNPEIQNAMKNDFDKWRQEIKIRILEPYAPEMAEEDQEFICYLMISMMQGASMQYHLEAFDLEQYMLNCRKTIVHEIQARTTKK